MYRKKTIFSFICLTEYIINIGNVVTMCTSFALFLWSRHMACGDGLSDYNHRSWLLLQKWLESSTFLVLVQYTRILFPAMLHSMSHIRRFCQRRDYVILLFLCYLVFRDSSLTCYVFNSFMRHKNMINSWRYTSITFEPHCT